MCNVKEWIGDLFQPLSLLRHPVCFSLTVLYKT